MISGRVLRADKSYKVVKFVFLESHSGPVKAFDSIYTMMNEFNQVIAIHFVRTGDYGEMEEILRSLAHRYKVHAYEEVELFYTDNCSDFAIHRCP